MQSMRHQAQRKAQARPEQHHVADSSENALFAAAGPSSGCPRWGHHQAVQLGTRSD
jgi:hypothetical protein